MSAAFIDRFITFLYYIYKTQFNVLNESRGDYERNNTQYSTNMGKINSDYQ